MDKLELSLNDESHETSKNISLVRAFLCTEVTLREMGHRNK